MKYKLKFMKKKLMAQQKKYFELQKHKYKHKLQKGRIDRF